MIRPCPRCGAKNRVPASKIDREPRCGRCRASLGRLEQPVAVGTAAELEELLRDAPVPVLVDFWAAWCAPCRTVEPELARIAREYAGDAVVVKVDAEKVPEAVARHRVRGVPTMILFRGGREAGRLDGAMPAAEIAPRLGL